MDTISCPQCGTEMVERPTGQGRVHVCPDGHGVFLPSAEVGTLVEAENDWHRNAGQHTAPLPRITADMTAPPTSTRRSRAWVESLFG